MLSRLGCLFIRSSQNKSSFNVSCGKLVLPLVNKMNYSSQQEPDMKYLDLPENRKIAYRNLPGTKSPGMIFIPGYLSNMTSSKATYAEKYCRENGYAFVRFDYEAVAESPGDFSKATLGMWKEDVLAVLNNLTTGPQILIGSSMGSWLALLAALELPEKVHSMLLISNAVNFTAKLKMFMNKLMQQELETKGEVVFMDSFKVTKVFIEEGYQHFIDLSKQVDINCPICIIHGEKDRDAPYSVSLDLARKLKTPDVDVIVRKLSYHRLSEDHDLEFIIANLDRLVKGQGLRLKPSKL